MTIVATRTFTAADGTSIPTAEPTLSAHPSSATPVGTILQNAVRGNANQTEMFLDSQDPGADDYEVSGTIRRIASGVISQLGPVCNLDPVNSTYIHARLNGTNFQLYHLPLGGSFTQIGTNYALGTLLDAIPSECTLTVGRTGGTAYMKVNGTQVRSGATTVTGRGRAGIRYNLSLANIVLDNMVIENALSGGDPPAGTVTISSVDPGETSALVTYSYDDTDETGYQYRIDGGTPATIGASPATISGLSASTEYDLEVRAVNGDGPGAWSAVSTFTTDAPSGDTTAPVLSSPVGTQTGTTTANVGATTDEGNGIMYAVVTTSPTQPSISQIKAGQDNGGSAAAWGGSIAVSSTGAKTLSATGLTAATSYYAHLVHTDAAANDSNRVVSSAFTTAAATGSFTSSKCRNGAGTLLNGASVGYALHVGAGVEDFADLDDFPPEKGSGTLNGSGQLIGSGHTLGAGLLLIHGPSDALFVEPVTVE